MKWKYAKNLKSVNLINDFERLVKYNFCDAFKECIITNNGGKPSKSIFDTNKGKEHELKSFLSFNKEDKETVWRAFEWAEKETKNKYVPFGIDNFGNMICFDKNNDSVIFINHENMSVELIANNFEKFIDVLYE